MKIQFHLRGLDLRAGLRDRFEQSIASMQRLIPIAASAAVLEYQRERTPAFRAFALLAVPGPDIHAEARDHTLEAAWLKLTTALRRQIERRRFQRNSRLKRNGHLRAPVRRRHSLAGLCV
jgi:ribosome-associated translation inhibitor RaiA